VLAFSQSLVRGVGPSVLFVVGVIIPQGDFPANTYLVEESIELAGTRLPLAILQSI